MYEGPFRDIIQCAVTVTIQLETIVTRVKKKTQKSVMAQAKKTLFHRSAHLHNMHSELDRVSEERVASLKRLQADSRPFMKG